MGGGGLTEQRGIKYYQIIALEQDKSDSKTVEEILCHGGQSDTGWSSLEQGAHLRKYHFLCSEGGHGSFPWKTLEVTKKIMSLQNSSNIDKNKDIEDLKISQPKHAMVVNFKQLLVDLKSGPGFNIVGFRIILAVQKWWKNW